MGLRGEPSLSTAPPDIRAQLNVNALESISLAQLELRGEMSLREWTAVAYLREEGDPVLTI